MGWMKTRKKYKTRMKRQKERWKNREKQGNEGRRGRRKKMDRKGGQGLGRRRFGEEGKGWASGEGLRRNDGSLADEKRVDISRGERGMA